MGVGAGKGLASYPAKRKDKNAPIKRTKPAINKCKQMHKVEATFVKRLN